MAVERTFSMIKPDATARNLTGKINAKLEEAGLRIVAQKRVWMSRKQAEGFYAVHSRPAVLRRTLRFHVVRADHRPGARRRERHRQEPRGDGRDRSGQGRCRHHPQGFRQFDRRELGARLRRAGDRARGDRLLVLGHRDRRLRSPSNRPNSDLGERPRPAAAAFLD